MQLVVGNSYFDQLGMSHNIVKFITPFYRIAETADFVSDSGYSYFSDGSYMKNKASKYDLVREDIKVDIASRLPGNIITHRAIWRKAIENCIKSAEEDDDKSHWEHELRAFDRTFDRLWALGNHTNVAR